VAIQNDRSGVILHWRLVLIIAAIISFILALVNKDIAGLAQIEWICIGLGLFSGAHV
jgi:hypothetical protein